MDAATKERLKAAAAVLDRTPHWLMKHAIVTLIAQVETGAVLEDLVDAALLESDTERNSVALRRQQCEEA